ncbi:MAG: hypothetical protein QXT13_13215 [Pyrobaculum sp.]
MGKYNVVTSTRAEDLALRRLENVPIVPPLSLAYEGILKHVESVNEGDLNSAWFAVIGLYGSGKTLLMRRIAHESVQRYQNIIPIYFYLGKKDEILLYDSLGEYVKEVEEYVNSNKPSTRVHGQPEHWSEKLEALKEAYNKITEERNKTEYSEDETEYSIELFFRVMKELNRKGYYPLILLDEFERIVYTGEGIRGSPKAISNFDYFSQHFLELTRGHIFKGVGVIALTHDLPELVKKAKNEGFPHVSEVEKVREGDYEKLEIVSPNIVFNQKYFLHWSYEHLKTFCEKLNISLSEDLIEIVSYTLPLPRVIISIYNRARELGIENVDSESFYKLIKDQLETLISHIRKYRTKNGKLLVSHAAKWDGRLKALLEEGYYFVKMDKLHEVSKLIREKGLMVSKKMERSEEEYEEERAFRTGRSIVETLVKYGLYHFDSVKKVYHLRPEIMAYLLQIERLPSGEKADLNRVVEIIESAIEEKRRKSEGRRRKRVESNEEKLT